MNLNRFSIVFFITLAGLSTRINAQNLPNAPNYSEPECWAALPSKTDWADYVPSESGFTDNQKVAEADVFYIHPTTALSLSTMKNARLNAKRFNKRTDFVILNQATVFNGS
ncbi:MAG: hypothetical protein AAGI07_05575, partial [Bacteroidota bacterium]